MTKEQVLDLYFIEGRSKLIDLAAFLDRHDRADGKSDHRFHALKTALELLQDDQPDKTARVLLSLSDQTPEPLAQSNGKAASGAPIP